MWNLCNKFFPNDPGKLNSLEKKNFYSSIVTHVYLNQICRQNSTAVSVVEIQRRTERGGGNAGEDGRGNHLSQRILKSVEFSFFFFQVFDMNMWKSNFFKPFSKISRKCILPFSRYYVINYNILIELLSRLTQKMYYLCM